MGIKGYPPGGFLLRKVIVREIIKSPSAVVELEKASGKLCEMG
jgi:hypothetical protein